MKPQPQEDIDHLVNANLASLVQLKSCTLLLTGCTGFALSQFLEMLAVANIRLDLGMRILAVSRSPERFQLMRPHVPACAIDWLTGDIATVSLPAVGINYIVHGVADPTNRDQPLQAGIFRVLEYAKKQRAKAMVYISSGAAQTPSNDYALQKNTEELNVYLHAAKFGIRMPIARIFSLLGPYLPLAGAYAASHFIRSGLASQEIVIQGHPKTQRSYLHTSDVAADVLTLLLKGNTACYEIGSSVPISIDWLAHEIGRHYGVRVSYADNLPTNPNIYIPRNCESMQALRGNRQPLNIHETLARTLHHFKQESLDESQ